MSKKELLNEAQVRRFMTLANLEPLVKNVIKETDEREEARKANQTPPSDKPRGTAQESVKEEYSMEADATPADMSGEEAPDMGMEMDSSPEDVAGDSDKEAVFAAAVKALANALGVEVEMGGDESGEEEGSAEDSAEDAAEKSDKSGEEEEMDEAKSKEEEMDEAKSKEEEMEENVALSEDSLVEAVLARVTARLVQEAKKAKEKKMTPKQKAEMKKKEMEAAKKKKLAEATSAEGGGPLLKQGKNKHDVYKGHADMTMAKGEKGGKGGHELETVSPKAEHTVTHGGKNLATLGGNKK